MTSDSSTSVVSPQETVTEIKAKTKTKRTGLSQERFMIMFTLFFIAGVLLLVLLPEEDPRRGWAMGIYSIVVFWAMFRFGL